MTLRIQETAQGDRKIAYLLWKGEDQGEKWWCSQDLTAVRVSWVMSSLSLTVLIPSALHLLTFVVM